MKGECVPKSRSETYLGSFLAAARLRVPVWSGMGTSHAGKLDGARAMMRMCFFCRCILSVA